MQVTAPAGDTRLGGRAYDALLFAGEDVAGERTLAGLEELSAHGVLLVPSWSGAPAEPIRLFDGREWPGGLITVLAGGASETEGVPGKLRPPAPGEPELCADTVLAALSRAGIGEPRILGGGRSTVAPSG